MSKNALISIIVVAAIVAAVGITAAVYFGAAPKHDEVTMIGHRGYSSKYPDNTALSFQKAAEHGSKGVETDVRITKDGRYVLSHDGAATFVDGTSLAIGDATLDELRAKPLKNDKTDDVVYLCSLEEYLEICKANMICFIELKGDEFNDLDRLEEVFNYIQLYYDLDKCELQSFDFDTLVSAQKLFPDLHFMLTWGPDRGNYEKCFEYGFDIDAVFSGLSQKMVKEFHERGLKVATWTCNEPLSLYYAYWHKVDYIESDVY